MLSATTPLPLPCAGSPRARPRRNQSVLRHNCSTRLLASSPLPCAARAASPPATTLEGRRSAQRCRVATAAVPAAAFPVSVASPLAITLAVPLWLVVVAGISIVGTWCLFLACLLRLLPALHAVRTSSDEVKVCAGAVVTACFAVEALAEDVHSIVGGVRAGLSAPATALKPTADVLSQASTALAASVAAAVAAAVTFFA